MSRRVAFLVWMLAIGAETAVAAPPEGAASLR